MAQQSRYDAEKIREELEVKKAQLKLPKFTPPSNLDEIMVLISSGGFAKEDPVTLQEWAVSLKMYSLFLGQEINRLKATVNWAEGNIKHIVGKKARDAGEMFWTEKESIIRANDEQCAKMDELRSNMLVQLDSFRDMDIKISNLADQVQNYARQKGYASKNW